MCQAQEGPCLSSVPLLAPKLHLCAHPCKAQGETERRSSSPNPQGPLCALYLGFCSERPSLLPLAQIPGALGICFDHLSRPGLPLDRVCADSFGVPFPALTSQPHQGCRPVCSPLYPVSLALLERMKESKVGKARWVCNHVGDLKGALFQTGPEVRAETALLEIVAGLCLDVLSTGIC